MVRDQESLGGPSIGEKGRSREKGNEGKEGGKK